MFYLTQQLGLLQKQCSHGSGIAIECVVNLELETKSQSYLLLTHFEHIIR